MDKPYLDLREIVEAAKHRGEMIVKLPVARYLMEGDVSYLRGVTIEFLDPPGPEVR